MKNKKFFILLWGVALVISVLVTGCSKGAKVKDSPNQSVQSESGEDILAGTAGELGSLRSFSAATLDGDTFTQADIAAKDMTVINFWSLMCGPCVAEMPDLAVFAKALPDHVQMITVCLDGTGNEEVAKSILNEAKYEGVTLLSGDGDFKEVSDHIQYTPTTVLVDSQGNLVGDAIIGAQKDLRGTFLMAVNTALKASGKAEIELEN